MIRMTAMGVGGLRQLGEILYGSKIFQVSSIQTPKHLCYHIQHLANLYLEQRTECCNGQKRWNWQVCMDGLSGCLRMTWAVN